MPTNIPYLWSDEFHFVRAATGKDRHPMRFVISPRRGRATTSRRHAPTKEAAIVEAQALTAHVLERSADARALLQRIERGDSLGLPDPSDLAPTPQAFATTLFDCVYANPVAQVWMMTRVPGEQRPVGRRRRNGQPAQGAAVSHEKGECAIYRLIDWVRDSNGRVTIYHLQGEAEEAAVQMYDAADEDDRLYWKPGNKVVGRTRRIDIQFDPVNNSYQLPFNLWLPDYNKQVIEMRTKSVAPPADALLRVPKEEHPEFIKNWRKHPLNREADLGQERPLLFASLQGAQAWADNYEQNGRG